MWVRMLAGFVYQQAIEIYLLYVVTTLGLVEWWSIQHTLLSEKTQPGRASWPYKVLRSPVSLNPHQDTECPHDVITSVSLICMHNLAQPKAIFITVSGLTDLDWLGILRSIILHVQVSGCTEYTYPAGHPSMSSHWTRWVEENLDLDLFTANLDTEYWTSTYTECLASLC
jgi:hypothetical protein